MKEKCLEIMAIGLVGGITSGIFVQCLQLIITIVMAKQTSLDIVVDLHSN